MRPLVILSGTPVSRRKAAGFTLTELAIVLGVVGTIFAVIWIAAGNVYLKQKTDDAMLELNTVVQNILGVWQGRDFATSGYAVGNDLTVPFANSNTLPNWIIVPAAAGGNPTASDPWNSIGGLTVTVGASTAGTTTKIFAIKFNNVPPQACSVMVTQAAACQAGMPGCPTQIVVTGAPAILPAGAAPNQQWNLTTETAAADCTGAGVVTNTIEFDYSL